MTTESHSFAEQYAKDFEPNGHGRIALNRGGTPAGSRSSVHSVARIVKVESLPAYRTRLTLESGRTMTMPDNRWVLTHYSLDYANN